MTLRAQALGVNRNLALSATALLTTLTIACGSPSHASKSTGPATAAAAVAADGTQSITLRVGNSMDFSPRSFTAAAGKPITLTLRNDGFIPHDFTLTNGSADPVKVAANPHSAGTTTFTLDRPGAYTFICSVPGHSDAGMKGTITVQ